MTEPGRLQRTAIGLITLVSVMSCQSTKPQVPAAISRLNDNQQATVGTAVAKPPAVSVVDADGKGIAGVSVAFSVTGGAGKLIGDSVVTTNSAGTATVTGWTLGLVAGVNTLSATATNVPGSPVTITAIGVADAPASMTKLSIDPSTGPAGGSIDSLIVRVLDEYGNPVGGATVTFAASAGSGSVSPTTTLTDGNGRAAAKWTLGSTVGVTSTATATVSGLATVVSFTTVTRIPVSAVRFSSLQYVVDSGASFTPSVVARDPQGTVIDGATIILASRSSSAASISGSTVIGSRAGQTTLIATSADNSAARDSAIVLIANPGAPVVTATVPRFDLKTDTVFTFTVVIDMRGSGQNAAAATLQLTWDPALLVFQSSAAGATVPSGKIAVNETAAPTGSLTMSFADATGFTGAIQVRNLTFKAGSTAGRVGTLSISILDLSTPTAASLQPKTVASSYSLRTR